MDTNSDVAVLIANQNIILESVVRWNGVVVLRCLSFDLICCYISPNCAFDVFEAYVDRLSLYMRSAGKDFVLAGDFNAKSPLWGSPKEDRRGDALAQLAAAHWLVPLNDGRPTFIRRSQETHIDVTFASEGLTAELRSWKVLEGVESMSPHQQIMFELGNRVQRLKTGCRFKSVDSAEFVRRLKRALSRAGPVGRSPGRLFDCVRDCQRASTVKGGSREGGQLYWWNDEVCGARRECIRLRRKYTRARSAKDTKKANQMWEMYKVARSSLKLLIYRAKRSAWNQLLDRLNDDIWGEGYQLITKRLAGERQRYKMPNEQLELIVNALFPERTEALPHKVYGGQTPDVTEEELRRALQRLKTGKAPGPDGVTVEIARLVGENCGERLLCEMNNCMRSQIFRREWKEAKLLLIPKSGSSPDQPSSYRPLCLINVFGKLLESVVKERIERELEEKGGLADGQHGFRKGRSTMSAMREVLRIGQAAKSKKKSERWCILITLDVRNAFNSASWKGIVEAMRRRGMSQYLINLILDYFHGRTLLVDGLEPRVLTAGIPQGSVVGPLLWNILYDGVVSACGGEGTTAIAFADDLALVITADRADSLVLRTNRALQRAGKWMKKNCLELAPQKTECIVLSGRRDRSALAFNLEGNEIRPAKKLKYLGVTIQQNMYFAEHINNTAGRAIARAGALSRIMPNVRGPSYKKRMALYGAIQSMLLYAAPIWGDMMRFQKYRHTVCRVQRRILLRVISGYRTVAMEAVQVIAAVPPLDLMIEERMRMFREGTGQTPAERSIERGKTIMAWQKRWDELKERGQWTKRLLPSLSCWINCGHRRTNFVLTQVLSGHGSFGEYTRRIGKTSEECRYCGVRDTTEHAIYSCPRWERERIATENSVGPLTPETTIDILTKSPESWKAYEDYATKIMKERIAMEHAEEIPDRTEA